MRNRCSSAFVCGLALLSLPMANAGAQTLYQQVNLVSDGSVPAAFIDPSLVNPWGISFSGGSPFWISDNHTGLTTLYNGTGAPIHLQTLPPPPPVNAVNIPAPGQPNTPTGAPTGTVFNGTSNFGGSAFLFATEDGTIAGWNPGVNRQSAQIVVPTTGNGAVFKGLGIQGGQLFATDFHNGTVNVYNSSLNLVHSYSDPNAPAGFAPFNVQNIGGKIYVTFAKQDADAHDDVAGLGNGFVKVLDPTTGQFTSLVSQGALDSPWGLAVAPKNFGKFSKDLLVGNFGDGHINAYDPTTGAFEGTLDDASGNPLYLEGLWGLAFGNGAAAGSVDKLYFTAGLGDPVGSGTNLESHGLFGSLASVPEPGSTAMVLAGVLTFGGLCLRRRRA